MLFLRACKDDFTSRGGFPWPREEGSTVEAPDWNPTPKCGGGLHGCSKEDGSFYLEEGPNKVFMVVEAAEDSVVSLLKKHKFPSCVIRKVGTLQECLDFLGWHLEDPGWAYFYSGAVQKAVPEVEEALSRDPYLALLYYTHSQYHKFIERNKCSLEF